MNKTMMTAVALMICLSPAWAKKKEAAPPERFPRYKTDGMVPKYNGEPLPNIVIFLVDDMGVMDTSVAMLTDSKGNPKRYRLNDFNRTPSMERFAEQGIRFETFCAQINCSPSRVSILTGQNASRHRTTKYIMAPGREKAEGPSDPPDWNKVGITEEMSILPQELKAKGYRTIHVGKAHLGKVGTYGANPLNLGFDVNIGGSARGLPSSYLGEDNYGDGKKNGVSGLEEYHGTDTFLTEALTLEAKKEVKLCAEANQPLFLHFSHYAVHSPYMLDKRFAENYADYEGNDPKANVAFATLIEGMDKSLGDMLDCFEALGIAENTLIFFLGDNGTANRGHLPKGKRDNHLIVVNAAEPLRGGKNNEYDGGTRVPFMAAWAKPDPNNPWQKKMPIAMGKIQTQLGSINDLYPTILELVGIPVPADHVIDGYSLKKRLTGAYDKSVPEEFLAYFPHKHRRNYVASLRDGDWRLVYYFIPEQAARMSHYELYNLADDLAEQNDLSKTNPEKLSTMVQKLAKELEDDNALYPVLDGKELRPIIP
ncbi:MAG: sulfatase-like hydrolase/transferase [Kiritimatiellia bacterium]|jgi:arylsulfatase A-like enzyme|nr:sulfatase-like hydrolase/transferase [Kiritimatiellia bacterium]